jgi:phage N-6-adenine-methyltransferase
MKGNDGTGNTIDRDDWETPQWLFNKLNEQYYFSYDCCASKNNSKCNIYFFEDFLKTKSEWKCFEKHSIFMNPPFSKAFEMFEHFINIKAKGVCIYRCDNMETKLW